MNRLSRIMLSFLFAFNGIALCIKRERNFVIQLMITVSLIAPGIYLHISGLEWIILLLCCGMVLCFEMVNSAIEHLCNFVHKDFHPSIGKVKDISAGAVLIASIFSIVIGLIIFIPKLFFT